MGKVWTRVARTFMYGLNPSRALSDRRRHIKKSSSKSRQRSTSNTDCAKDIRDGRQQSFDPRDLARAWFLATAVYSDIQFGRRSQSQSVLSNTTISAGACFGRTQSDL